MKTLAEALASIREDRSTFRGVTYVRHICDLGEDGNGTRRRIARSDRAECEKAVRSYFAALGVDAPRQVPTKRAASLTSAAAEDAAEAFALLKDYGLYGRGLLTEIARAYVESSGSKWSFKTVRDAYREYVASFDPRQDTTISLTKRFVGAFAERHGDVRVRDAVTPENVMSAIAEGGSPATRNIIRSRLLAFVHWCSRPHRRYVKEAVWKAAAAIEKERSAERERTVADLHSVRRAFVSLKHDFLTDEDARCGYTLRAALGFFCGVRTGEIGRLERCDLKDDWTLFVRKAKGYVTRECERSFTVTDTARRWLETIDLDRAFMKMPSQAEFDRWLTVLEKSDREGRTKYPRNAMRHSFISYHIAAYENRALTCTIAGTSDRMVKDHYRKCVSRTEGEEFFRIVPDAV